MIKYSSDDLKKLEFGSKISRDTRKVLFKNNIWNPDHTRQFQQLIIVKIHLLSQSIEILLIK